MPRMPIEIDREPACNVAYIRYRDCEVWAGKTVSYADHQIAVNVDDDGIAGIDILSLRAEELAALALFRYWHSGAGSSIAGSCP